MPGRVWARETAIYADNDIHLSDNTSVLTCCYLSSLALSIRERQIVLPGSTALAVAFTMVIATAATTTPVIPVNQRTGIRDIALQLPDMAHLLGFWL